MTPENKSAPHLGLLGSLHRYGREATKARGSKGQVTLNGMQSLLILFHLGPRVQTKLAKELDTSTATATKIADVFEAWGWATRKQVPKDRRKWLLTLTKKGRAVAKRVDPAPWQS